MGEDWSGFELDVEDEMGCQHFRVGYGETNDIGQPTKRWYYVEVEDKITNKIKKIVLQFITQKKIEELEKLVRIEKTLGCILNMLLALGCLKRVERRR